MKFMITIDSGKARNWTFSFEIFCNLYTGAGINQLRSRNPGFIILILFRVHFRGREESGLFHQYAALKTSALDSSLGPDSL
jgi:hypothetical protein